MSRQWETRNDGRMCLVIDPEDGTHPQRVYGKDKDEILEKVARTVEHSARHIAALKSAETKPAAGTAPGQPTPPAAPRKVMTADEQMKLTQDLANPAKAPAAARALVDEATGGALTEFEQDRIVRRRKAAVDRVANLAAVWSQTHPDFPMHPVNQKMLIDTAALRVGFEQITEQTLTQVFLELMENGTLVPAQEDQEEPASGQPSESSAPRPARGRESTSYRKNGLRAAPPAPAAPQAKYTRAQVDAMNSDQLAHLMRTEPGFGDLLASYSQPRRATA